LVDKLGARVACNYSFGFQNCKQVWNDIQGNYLLISFLVVLLYSLLFACFAHLFCNVGMHVISTPAPFTNTAGPIIVVGSATPWTCIRTVRIRQPSKVLLPPYSFILTTEEEDMLYNKVIVHMMTLSKCAKLGLQVQSVVERVNFPHEGNLGLISNSWGIAEKLLSTCKTIPRSCVSNSTEWLSRTRCECK
jgi:hypothetical protein